MNLWGWIAVVLAAAIAAASVTYVVLLRREIRRVGVQLDGRLRESSGAALSVQMFDRELNALVAHTNELLASAENARAKNQGDERAFRSMISDIAHDLRTPLTVVRGYQQLLRRSELTEKQSELLRVAESRAAELAELIDQLFTYAYLLESEPRFSIEAFDVSGMVADQLINAVAGFEEAGMRVEFNPSERIMVHTDTDKLSRILSNLIGNAIKHGSEYLRAGVQRDGENVRIVFTNPMKEKPEVDPSQMFERFYTVDRSRLARGTGLGLSIVKLLVDQLHGDVKAVLDEDGAITFTVVLPDLPA